MAGHRIQVYIADPAALEAIDAARGEQSRSDYIIQAALRRARDDGARLPVAERERLERALGALMVEAVGA